jgi:hypothetical protein
MRIWVQVCHTVHNADDSVKNVDQYINNRLKSESKFHMMFSPVFFVHDKIRNQIMSELGETTT